MAVITNRIKKQVIGDVITDFDSSGTQYFIGIGRSQDWNDSDVAPSELNHQREEKNFRHSMQSIKTIADISFVIPRYNWSSGSIYSAYSDAVSGYPSQAYYVMNDNNQVYICIQQAKAADGTAAVSTIQPTGNTSGTPFTTADDYVWKFLYSISAIDASKFISADDLVIVHATVGQPDCANCIHAYPFATLQSRTEYYSIQQVAFKANEVLH